MRGSKGRRKIKKDFSSFLCVSGRRRGFLVEVLLEVG